MEKGNELTYILPVINASKTFLIVLTLEPIISEKKCKVV